MISSLFFPLLVRIKGRPVLPLPEHPPDMNPNAPVLIIFYNPEAGTSALMEAVETCGATLLYRNGAPHSLAVALPDTLPAATAERFFWQVRGVVLVYRENKAA